MQSVSTDLYAGLAGEDDDADTDLGAAQVGESFDNLRDEGEHLVVVWPHATRSINDEHDVGRTVQCHCAHECRVNGVIYKNI